MTGGARAKTQSQSPGTAQLLEGPVAPVLWRLASPNVLAVTMVTAVSFADAWYVGHLGTAALASLALAFPVLSLMQAMAAGAIGGGITSSVARAVGGGSIARAEQIAWHAVLIALVMAAAYTLILGLFARPIFTLLGGTGEALEGAVAFARIAFGGAIAVWLLQNLSAIVRGTGDTLTPARIQIIAAAAQIPLSGALTLGWLGLPSFGVAGGAAALVTCQGIAAISLAIHLIRGSGRLRLRPHALRWAPLRDILKVGGIGLFNSTGMAMTVVVVTGYVGRYGTEALAGFGLGARLEVMMIPIAFGVGAAMTAAVGVNVGAGQMARARRFAWTGAGAIFVLTGLIGLVVALFPGLWLNLFTSNQSAYAVGALYFAIVAPLYGIYGAGQALYFASQGTGRIVLPVTVTVSRFLVVTALGALALHLDWGLGALFVTVAIGLAIFGLGQALCLFGPGWRGA